MSNNLKTLKLYKSLLKESSKFTNYNFRFVLIIKNKKGGRLINNFLIK